jgi:hypothetical protein
MDNFDALSSGPAWFLSEPLHVLGVACEQDDRARLGQRHLGDHRIQGTSMAGQAGPSEQLPGASRPFRINRYDGHIPQNPMNGSISLATAQHLGQNRCANDHVTTTSASGLEQVCGPRITLGELHKAFGI